jgi:glycine/D-amino acid oxidase-like deaminating enzyme
MEPIPSFDFTRPLRCIAGVRPCRTAGYRLDGEQSESDPTKYIVHNYGHGGGGINLSWGTASKVRDLVRDRIAAGDTAVAVIGSGVMGLTAATLLLELGVRVTIYAKELWTETTSHVAGGQWAPSVVLYSNEQEFKEVLKMAYKRFKASIGQGFGVSKVPNYAAERNPAFDKVFELCPGLIPPSRRVGQAGPFNT